MKLIEQDSGVGEEIKEDGFYTILAPSDHVFKTLPQDELDMIMEDEAIKKSIAQKHILNGEISFYTYIVYCFIKHKKNVFKTLSNNNPNLNLCKC